MCIRPGQFVRFAPHPNITLTSSRVHPFLQASARDALWAAAEHGEIRINSAFRTLADQYVLYNSGGCGLAALPGRSNHQTGRAVDLQNHSSRRSAMQSAGCSWLGSSDPVHFDCPGTDRRSDAVLAFQRLWNVNNPSDRIAEDGVYGSQTGSRMGRSPAAGFPLGACTCEPTCDGSVVIGSDCSRSDCAGFGGTCSTALGDPLCVSLSCVTDPAVIPNPRDVCLPDGTIARCNAQGALEEPRECEGGESCQPGVAGATCGGDVPPGMMMDPPDVSRDLDAGAADARPLADPRTTTPQDRRLHGQVGCAAGKPGPAPIVPAFALVAWLIVWRRQR